MCRCFIIISIASITLGMAFIAFPDGAAALLVVLTISLALIGVFRHFADEKDFVTNIFLTGLLLRLAFGIIIHVFDLRDFFGGDATTYDYRGNLILNSLLGHLSANDPELQLAAGTTGPGWGMNYLVAFIYLILGRNIFAAQSFCAVIGAAAAPMVYFCSNKIFKNNRV